MEIAAASATSSLKTVNILGTPLTQRLINPKTLTPTWPPAKPNMVTFYVPRNIDSRNLLLSLTRCSTKPDTNTNNETGQDPTFNTNQIPDHQNPPTPISNDSLPSPLLSSTSSSSRGLVLDLGPEDSWDSKGVGSPVVKRFLSDEEERWYMWYQGSCGHNPGSDSIGLAVSSNGIHWERGMAPVGSRGDVGLVMKCGQDWWAFDTLSISPSEVVIMSSSKVRASSAVYWLYYTGFSPEKADCIDDLSLEFNVEYPERFGSHDSNHGDGGNGRIFKSLPGLAISQDGRHWARIEGEHHSGALFDVGSEGEWDSSFIAGPQVVFHGNGDLRMYYHSFDVKNGNFCVGIGRSRDGIRWVKLGKIMGGGKSGSFDEYGAMNPCVVKSKKDGKYVMVYEGVAADGERSIGLAVSPDGLKDWRRVQDGAVLKPSGYYGWDSKQVGSPYLVQMEGDVDEWRLYYRGFGLEGRSGIGMAVCQGNDISSFSRWTGFQL